MARRWRGLLRLLPLLALFGLLSLGTAAQSVQHMTENVRLVQVSVRPTASMHISSESVDNLKVQESAKSVKMEVRMEEEKTLNDLVGLLQDVVKNIPTKQAEAPLSTEASAIVIPNMEPSPSETDDTVWVSLTPKAGGMQMEPSQTVASTKTTLTTTAFWKLRKDASASVILHSDMTTSEKTTPENLKSETAASVLYSNNATPGKALVRVSLLMKTGTTTGKSKSFDQLTNGALASLVESLKNVKKIHMTLHKVSNKPQEGDNNGKVVEVHQHKPAVADILELIDTLIATIKNAPSSVKKDPALRKYIEKAESFLKNALELAAEAEKKLMQKNQKQENKLQPEIPPSPPTTVLVSEVTIQVTPSSTEPLTKKAEDAQVELGKLKAFINLLYGFSPHLTSYAQNSNSTGKKVAEDIVERAMAVLDAIKSIFCGNPEGRSKQVLKQLLKDDMELVRQAMNEKRVS